jgi:hypothetical protein
MSVLGWTRGGQPPAHRPRVDYLRHILWSYYDCESVVITPLWVVIIHDEVQVHFTICNKHGVVPLTPFVEVPR